MNKKLSHKSNELVLLRALFAEKEAQNNELQLTVDKLNDALKESEARYQSLLEKMQLARHRQFGASSESLPKEDCVFNEAEEVSSDTLLMRILLSIKEH